MRYELTDGEWAAIRLMFPNKPRSVPRVDDRPVLNGIFWVLRSGAPRRDLRAIRPIHHLLQWLCALETGCRLGPDHGRTLERCGRSGGFNHDRIIVLPLEARCGKVRGAGAQQAPVDLIALEVHWRGGLVFGPESRRLASRRGPERPLLAHARQAECRRDRSALLTPRSAARVSACMTGQSVRTYAARSISCSARSISATSMRSRFLRRRIVNDRVGGHGASGASKRTMVREARNRLNVTAPAAGRTVPSGWGSTSRRRPPHRNMKSEAAVRAHSTPVGEHQVNLATGVEDGVAVRQTLNKCLSAARVPGPTRLRTPRESKAAQQSKRM